MGIILHIIVVHGPGVVDAGSGGCPVRTCLVQSKFLLKGALYFLFFMQVDSYIRM